MLDYKKQVYIAHPLGMREKIRDEIIPILSRDFDIITPFSNKRMKKWGDKKETEINAELWENNITPRWIVSHDFKNIAKCDALIAFLPYNSYGTIREIGFAVDNLGIPVMIISDMERAPVHPWVRYDASIIVKESELAKGIEKLKEWFDID